jgi:hypothetical protein
MHQLKFGTKFLLLILICFTSSSCSIYTSSDRKKFETDTSQLISFEYSNNASCSSQSLNAFSTSTKELYTTERPQDGGPLLVRQLVVNDQLVYETDNLKGVYCVYQNH